MSNEKNTHTQESCVVETHSAWVVMLGDRVYKVKKPVRFDFLDFSTLEARATATRREVELNRRIAPDVYLGVCDVLGPDGLACEHLVMMRRMPQDRRLATVVRTDEPAEGHVRAVARLVAAFHAGAGRSPQISAVGQPEEVRAKVTQDLSQMQGFAGNLLDPSDLAEVGALAMAYLGGRRRLLEARVAAGCVVDGHGDLLADDIFCLDDGPRVLDCIEFDDRLRYGDVLADLAFLAMDLEYLGRRDLAELLVEAYDEFTDEHHPTTLADYYVAFRAIIRCKVACLRSRQGDPDAGEQARTYLSLALRHLRRAQVRLVLVGGPPGTGKSTLAAGLSDTLGWTLLRSDLVRKDLCGLGHQVDASAGYGQGIYDHATTAATYETLLDRARMALELGESVVLDASWSSAAWRERATALASASRATLVELRCDVPEPVMLARVAERRRTGGDPSDATEAVAQAMWADFEPWPTATPVVTEYEAAEVLREVLQQVLPEMLPAGPVPHDGAAPDGVVWLKDSPVRVDQTP